MAVRRSAGHDPTIPDRTDNNRPPHSRTLTNTRDHAHFVQQLSTPGGELWLITGAGSRKHRLIEAAGYFSLMAERLEPSVCYVAVDGPVSRIEPGTDGQLVEMSKRYLPPDKVEPYLEMARREHGESVAIWLTPQHWLSADLGAL